MVYKSRVVHDIWVRIILMVVFSFCISFFIDQHESTGEDNVFVELDAFPDTQSVHTGILEDVRFPVFQNSRECLTDNRSVRFFNKELKVNIDGEILWKLPRNAFVQLIPVSYCQENL